MDSEWVGRAGIIAEAVSFILIAPEILGEQRCRRAERVLEGWLEKREPLSILLSLALAAAAYGGAFVAIMLALTVWDVGVPRAVLIAGALLFGGALVFPLLAVPSMLLAVYLKLRERDDSATRRVTGFWPVSWPRIGLGVLIALIVPFGPSAYVLLVVSVTLVSPVRLFLLLASRLLQGPDRLRALVFGSGVVLLFGGLLTQFAATF